MSALSQYVMAGWMMGSTVCAEEVADGTPLCCAAVVCRVVSEICHSVVEHSIPLRPTSPPPPQTRSRAPSNAADVIESITDTTSLFSLSTECFEKALRLLIQVLAYASALPFEDQHAVLEVFDAGLSHASAAVVHLCVGGISACVMELPAIVEHRLDTILPRLRKVARQHAHMVIDVRPPRTSSRICAGLSDSIPPGSSSFPSGSSSLLQCLKSMVSQVSDQAIAEHFPNLCRVLLPLTNASSFPPSITALAHCTLAMWFARSPLSVPATRS
jgi:hypothetical protein